MSILGVGRGQQSCKGMVANLMMVVDNEIDDDMKFRLGRGASPRWSGQK